MEQALFAISAIVLAVAAAAFDAWRQRWTFGWLSFSIVLAAAVADFGLRIGDWRGMLFLLALMLLGGFMGVYAVARTLLELRRDLRARRERQD